MSASEWLKQNAPPEVQAEIQENFRFALDSIEALTLLRRLIHDDKASPKDVVAEVQARFARAERLHELIHNPHTEDFLEAVRTEAAHQRERWGTDHDAGKSPEDWLFLMGYLGTKACQAHGKLKRATERADENGVEHSNLVEKHREKALHHTISTAGACLNWHAAISEIDTTMRPGIKPPKDKS